MRRIWPSNRWVQSSLLVWILAIGLFIWVLSTLSLADIVEVLRRLQFWQVGVLVALNALIAVMLSGRWWLILRAQGYRLPYLRTSGYRLSASSVSYFTPGPQLGGEPVQVYMPVTKHDVPTTTATAAVALDKTLELLINFFVLLLGGVAILMVGLQDTGRSVTTALLPLFLLALPLSYLSILWRGRLPLTWFTGKLPRSHKMQPYVLATETQIASFCREQPVSVLIALLFSAFTWVMMYLEYWLAARFLGIPLTGIEALAALTAARFAFLFPVPSGLGVLEASQALAIGALGYGAADGAALALLIRIRDITMGLIGLWLLAFFWRRTRPLPEATTQELPPEAGACDEL